MNVQSNPDVVSDLLARYTFTNAGDLMTAAADLSAGLKLSMEHTNAYNIPLDQKLPPEQDRGSAAPYVHPFNIATALVSVVIAGPQFGAQLAVDPSLQIYVAGIGWQAVAGSQVTPAVIQPTLPPPQAEIPPAPPPAAAAPVPPAPPVQPDLSSLVNAALQQPAPAHQQPAAQVQALPATITTPEEFAAWRASQGYATPVATPAPVQAAPPIVAPDTQPSTPVAPVAPQAQPQPAPAAPLAQPAASGTIEFSSLPDASVTAERTSEAGRPSKSPFERDIEKRLKLAAAPWWWKFMRYSAGKVFTHHPSAALDPSSTGSGPVQAYALLLALLQHALRSADGRLTVAELRTFLAEIQTGIDTLPTSEAISQLVESLFND